MVTLRDGLARPQSRGRHSGQRGSGIHLPKQVLSALAMLALCIGIVLSLAAQQVPTSAPSNTPTATMTGQVRTAGGVAIPGATLRLVETGSGRAWMSWTDENGRFALPGLPAGHYRVEVSQLGFDVAVSESDVAAAPPPPPLEITMKVASLEAMAPPLAAPAAQEQAGAAGTANASTEAAAESARPAAGPGSGWSRRIPRGTRERRCRGQRRRSGPAECARGEGSHRGRRQWPSWQLSGREPRRQR